MKFKLKILILLIKVLKYSKIYDEDKEKISESSLHDLETVDDIGSSSSIIQGFFSFIIKIQYFNFYGFFKEF